MVWGTIFVMVLTVVIGVFSYYFWKRKKISGIPTQPFDQTFTKYSREFGYPHILSHRKDYKGCNFITRILRNCVPDNQILCKSIYPNYDRFLQIKDTTRIYYLHIPKGIMVNLPKDNTREFYPPKEKINVTNNNKKYPLVILIHGTDETCFDSEFVCQKIGNPQQKWFELSDKEEVILLFAQARGLWADNISAWREPNDYLKTLWLTKCIDSNELDHFYLEKAIDDALEICPQIDTKKIFIVGFSNGGFFACDLVLAVNEVRDSDSASQLLPHFKYPLAGACLYMGGISELQMGKTLKIDKHTLPNINNVLLNITSNEEQQVIESKNKPCVLVITATYETQIFSCLHAVQCLYKLGYKLKYINMPEKYHKYYPESTDEIWSYFKNCVK